MSRRDEVAGNLEDAVKTGIPGVFIDRALYELNVSIAELADAIGEIRTMLREECGEDTGNG